MFGSKRHRPPAPVLTRATANPSAATAAAAVFKPHERSSSLSSAAAAAALKARPTTPTNVGEVQTKRMMRRSGSVSSSGTAEGQGRPPLQRRGSQGSMTERTFRSPSPHRPGSSGSGQDRPMSMSTIQTEEAPPVPAIPKDLNTRPESGKRHVKSLSSGAGSLRLGSPPLRLASQTLGNPDHASWFGGAAAGDPANVRTSDAAMHTLPASPPPPTGQDADGRPHSRGSSINFSYPARLRVGSPLGSPTSPKASLDLPAPASRDTMQSPASERRLDKRSKRLSSESSMSQRSQRPSSVSSDHSLVWDPNSRRMVPRADLLAIEQAVRDSSGRSSRSRKKRQSVPKTGTHLAQGTVGRVQGTAVGSVDSGSERGFEEPERSLPSPVTASRPAADIQVGEDRLRAQAAPPTAGRQQADSLQEGRRRQDTQPVSPEPVSPRVEHFQHRSSPPAAGAVRRMPSVVKEEPEPESDHAETAATQGVSEAIDAVPTKDVVFPPTHEKAPDSVGVVEQTHEPSQAVMTTLAALPSELVDSQERRATERRTSPSEHRSVTDLQGDRTHSISPVRTARFGPVQQEGLMVRHSPPPRSISPMKSALKPQSPPRGASPSDDTSEASGSVNTREETIPRRRSVRVSFDDENTVVVGEAAAASNQGESSVAPGPQAVRRPWYSNIGRSKRKEIPSLEDDVVMQPRPALPSFGSIRDKKPKEPEERPLVRPLEPAYSPAAPASPAIDPVVPPVTGSPPPPEQLGPSSDHAIGALLTQEQKSRNEANISKYREPLPPVVTSIEGNGYVSDSSSAGESSKAEPDEADVDGSDIERQDFAPAIVAEHPSVSDATEEPHTTDWAHTETPASREPKDEAPALPEAVPSISVSTPSPEAKPRPKTPVYDVPGGFPQDESDASTIRDAGRETPTTPVRRETFEPVAQRQDTASSHLDPAATLTGKHPAGDESDTETSIYSDAYEDLSDLEGGGFLSLDAVVDSPVAPALPRSDLVAAPLPKSEPVVARSVAAPLVPQLSETSTYVGIDPPQEVPVDDWEKAKAYWRGLTADKRAQLEREAQEEAATEADLDQARNRASKPKKKKSVERRNSERKAIQERAKELAAQRATANPERTYQIKPGTKHEEHDDGPQVLRTTMRGKRESQPVTTAVAVAPAEKGTLRKSMRSEGGMKGSRPADTQQNRPTTAPSGQRVMSFPPPTSAAVANASAGKHMRTTSGASSPPVSTGMSSFFPPVLKRRGSTSSESSFRRSRPSLSEGLGFRKTLRSATMPQAEAGTVGRPATARSPPPVSMSTNMHIRRTLRDATAAEQSESKSSRLHMPSFGLSSSKKKKKNKAAGGGGGGSGTKFSSRFDNSSDEEDVPASARFRSRFDDDSSEDERQPALDRSAGGGMPKTMRRETAARPQPQQATQIEPEEESEELPDSDDEKDNPRTATNTAVSRLPASKTPTLGTSALNRPQTGRGSLPLSYTAPVIGTASTTTATKPTTTAAITTTITSPAVARPVDAQRRRSSFMATILRRKKPDASGKIQRGELTDSAARRDTTLERSPRELAALRNSGDDDRPGGGERAAVRRPTSPKLQKRYHSLLAEAAGGGSWPLPGAVNDEKEEDKKGGDADDVVRGEEEGGDDVMEALRRPKTSSANLGTRTMSLSTATTGTGSRPGLLQRRTVSGGSTDLLNSYSSHPAAAAGGMVDGVEPIRRKKKFGALRRMFKLDD